MRIAILNRFGRIVGGVETYLQSVCSGLSRRGVDVALWSETEGPLQSPPIALPATAPRWCASTLGLDAALAALRQWSPDVLFSQGLLEPEVEARALTIAPVVFGAHSYHGTCISGAKMFKSPTNVPCSRRFGWPCLLHYYPRRCGGWSAVTMVRQFQRQHARLNLLPKYKAIVTLSSHMQAEFSRHGLEATWIKGGVEPAVASSISERRASDSWNLLFVGRLEPVKGGHYFIDALPRVAATLARSLHVTFAGDGQARASWQSRARAVASREPRVRVDFTGWLQQDRVDVLLAAADLVVVPSLWPEPFGLVGLEAARHRVPVAAFRVGGIPDWLHPGVNGQLAPGDPPTPNGLAGAIIECLKDPDTHARLREGAGRVAAEFDLEDHVDELMRVFAEATRSQ